ncbi:hypothetical protein XFFB_00225 [Xylella fastidiosa]|nr:hypothetical protein XFFB_00225 [Xylella fastidiosa]
MRAHRLVNKVMPFEQLFIAVNGTPNKPDECTNQNSEALYILIINTMTVTQNQSNMVLHAAILNTSSSIHHNNSAFLLPLRSKKIRWNNQLHLAYLRQQWNFFRAFINRNNRRYETMQCLEFI